MKHALIFTLLLSACGGAEFESELFVGSGGVAGEAGVAGAGGGGSGGAAGAAGETAGTAGASQDAGNDACEIVDDGNACTVDVCDTHTPVAVDDGKECTTDTCDPLTGLVSHEEIPPHWQCQPCETGWYVTDTNSLGCVLCAKEC